MRPKFSLLFTVISHDVAQSINFRISWNLPILDEHFRVFLHKLDRWILDENSAKLFTCFPFDELPVKLFLSNVQLAQWRVTNIQSILLFHYVHSPCKCLISDGQNRFCLRSNHYKAASFSRKSHTKRFFFLINWLRHQYDIPEMVIYLCLPLEAQLV